MRDTRVLDAHMVTQERPLELNGITGEAEISFGQNHV